jgi:hypothetical protein
VAATSATVFWEKLRAWKGEGREGVGPLNSPQEEVRSVARRRRSKQEVQEERQVSRIEKASHWLAHALMVAVGEVADPPDDRGDPIMKRRLRQRKLDIEGTLELSLEAYALAMTDQNADRADALIEDLRSGRGGGYHYFDLLEIREIGRRFLREQDKRKKRIAALEKLGVRSKAHDDELKQLRALVRRCEEDG